MNIPIQSRRLRVTRRGRLSTGGANPGQAPLPPSLTEILQLHIRIQQGLAAGQSAQAMAEQLCEMVRCFVPERFAMLMRLDEGGRLRVLAAPGVAPSLVAAIDGKLKPRTSAGAGGGGAEAMQAGRRVIVEDVDREPRWTGQREAAAALGIFACWSIQVCQYARMLGAFMVCGPRPSDPDPAITRVLEHGATIAGVILRLLDLQDAGAKQHRKQRRQTERLARLTGFHAMLSQVNQLAADRPDVTTLYEGICRIAVQQGGMRLAWIGVPDQSGVFHSAAASVCPGAGAAGSPSAGGSVFPDAGAGMPAPDGAGMSAAENAAEAAPAGAGMPAPAGAGMSASANAFGAAALLNEALAAANLPDAARSSLSLTAWREARTVVRRRRARSHGLCADVVLPLMLRGTPQAVLHVYAAEGATLDRELIRLLEDLAVDVGRALEAIDQQHHLSRLSALHSALMTQGEMLLRARTDNEMLEQTCAHLAEGALFHVAWIAQPNAKGRMRALASAGLGIAPLAELPLSLDDDPPALVVQCWLKGHTVVSNDMQADPDLAHYRHLIESGGWGSAAIVPIRRNGACFAVLALGAAQPGVFVPDVLTLCERIAALLGRGLDEFDLKQTLERERRQQFHLARHDPLTSLPNRRQFEEHLRLALAGAGRRGGPLCVCMMDVDDFKSINDRYGHAAGDALLREVGSRLRETLRRSDMIARLGGDEFALAIDDRESVASLPRLMERISLALGAPFELDGHAGIRVGMSAGLAVYPDDGAKAALLLRRADAALYAAKADKTGPGCNWRRWSEEVVSTAPLPGIDDPYGPEARALLTATESVWPEVATTFVDAFYAAMADQTLAAPILTALSGAEFATLKSRQAASLIMLMAATTDRDTVRRMAQRVGMIHALSGVDSVLMVQALGLYQSHLAKCLGAQRLRPSDRQRVMGVALARLQEYQAEEMEGSARTVAAYFDPPLFAARHSDAAWVDVVQAQLDALAKLPGILSVRLLRPDASGTLETLASSSTAGFPYGGLDISDSNRATIDRTRPEGRGLLSEAWHGGRMASTVNYQTDPRTAPWHEAAKRFGVRSAVALPVLDLEGRPVAAVLMFGAYPHQFESMWIRHVCSDLTNGLSLQWHRRQAMTAAVVVPEKTAVAWRQRLFAGGLVTHYQPIVDLRSGRLQRVEALVRLELEDGRLIAPERFGPILGTRDRDMLFRLGLAQALAQAARWDAEGLSLGVHVNLRPSTLCQPGCALWVRDALCAVGMAPERLFLEITESHGIDPEDRTVRPAFAALDDLGVSLVMDNLGSAYGSLHRLRTLPFRAIKLDRGLVHDMSDSPARSMSFVGALVQLGRDLGIDVLAEGLETGDLLEAAAVLGADAGQGSALGGAMPAEAIAGWARDFAWTVQRNAPRTALGGLAATWGLAEPRKRG